jgi:mutual gliding-motility protein MglA
VSTVNPVLREIAAKIVFYGPGLSGKTTTLQKIHESVRPTHRGEMMSLATEGDRTLFFDFLPVKVDRVGEFSVRLALYTVPGQVFYNATRQLVLQSADGVVFVADSQPAALDNNLESMKNLEENLQAQGIRLEKFPLVIQYNKRDLTNVMPVSELRAKLNPRGVPDFETCATSGRGVLDSLKAITRGVLRELKTKKVVGQSGEKKSSPVFEVAADGLSSLADRLDAQINQAAEANVKTTKPTAAVPKAHEPPPMGALTSLASLAPAAFSDFAKAADAAFIASDVPGCIRACTECVRIALSQAGGASLEAQAFMLNVHGPDVLKLQGLAGKADQKLEDAAFAMYVAMQAFVRLKALTT